MLAHAGGTLAGYALLLFRRGARTARLYGLAVRAADRGRGVGAALLREAERRARRRDCRSMSLEVGSVNRSALSLYRSMGYAVAERLPRYYEDGSDALRLRRVLAPPRR